MKIICWIALVLDAEGNAHTIKTKPLFESMQQCVSASSMVEERARSGKPYKMRIGLDEVVLVQTVCVAEGFPT